MSVSILLSCSYCAEKQPPAETANNTSTEITTFEQEVDFLNQYTEIHLLEEPGGDGVIAISPALQARVMTSSSNGMDGRSYGWINRAHFESRDTLDHMNPFGGEERFWLGPEGGQYSIFFKAGADFTLKNWQTPALIDLEPFALTSLSKNKASYSKEASITNYAGFDFEISIQRDIEILSRGEIFELLNLTSNNSLELVGYRSTNTLTNTGEQNWQKETGLLSIWLLGMFNPSETTTVIVPFKQGDELGPVVNDSYFGKVPSERLKINPGVIFFKGDGNSRGKIGLSAARAKDLIAAYDPISKTLTIIKYTKPPEAVDYVNSLWEIQETPYQGDVVNSYNDGPLENGELMGPFYELESSSPALELKVGESGKHVQTTIHIEGNKSDLEAITSQLFGVTLMEIETAFEN